MFASINSNGLFKSPINNKLTKIMKQLYKITTKYTNTEFTKSYEKSFSHSYFAKQFCESKEKSIKIERCTYENIAYIKGSTAKKVAIKPKAALRPVKGSAVYFRDNAGYKYYINAGEKIKSPKPVFEPIITY